MWKKGLGLFVGLMTFCGVGSICQAEIIPPYGPGQIGYTAVVLCDSLTIREEASSASAAVKTLHSGDRMMVMEQKDGWAYCATSDAVDAGPDGWVNADYIVVDPSWYRTEEKTTVYAWNDTAALKVARLDKDTTLPVLKDDGEWLVVGLRGASGWIHKTDAELANASDNKSESSESSPAAKADPEEDDWFTVYAEDGSYVSIHLAEGAMYEDTKGRTYSNTHGDYYYCITTDITYSANPDSWANGDRPEYTGEDYGEGAGYENNWDDEYDYTDTTGDGEGAGYEDNWNDGAYYGEGAGYEDNWED